MANWRAMGVVVVGVAIVAIASWAYRGIELLEGKAAFAARNYPRAAADLKPFDGWNDSEAQQALADMYANGLGLPENDGKAFLLATKSANTGLVFAETLLGTLYQEGRGTPVDETQAAFWFRQAAVQGNTDAQTKLGEDYVRGLGVGQDYGQAASLFQQAANLGNPEAQYDLGRLYVVGLGEPKDDGQAAQLFRTSAALGDLDAAVNLGILYHEGAGVPRDDGHAVQLFKPAAAAGSAVAEYYLGLAYMTGAGVGADPAQAIAWLRRAAIQGDPAAQTALGQVFEQPGTMDAVLAYTLFDLAAGQGNAVASADQARLEDSLTPAQRAKAQALARSWIVNTPLPVTDFEDRAPQVVFGLAGPPAVYQASRIWFSRAFSLAGQNFHATFIARPQNTCHGCGALISVATFRLTGNGVAAGLGQADFTSFGTGFAAPEDDRGAGAGSTGGVAAIVQPVAADRVVVLVPITGAGPRGGGGEEMFGFALKDPADPQSGAWRDLGQMTTLKAQVAAGAASDDCAADTAPAGAALRCAAWQGVVSVAPGPGVGWQDMTVKASGTALDARKKAAAAADELYRFNGRAYELVPGAGMPKA